ncbi:NfeD family protein [Kaarinaea lacus]
MEFLAIFNPWHWWMLASLLLVAELLSPCAYFLALAVPSAVVGLAWKTMPGLTVEWQLGLFVGLSLITLGLAHQQRSRRAMQASSEK